MSNRIPKACYAYPKSPNNPYPISEESYVELLEKNSWKM
ncbi:Uncharacterised protein [Mannheimia haemolytica]|nr:Uncharacterised protein [Mannheimia haemolytica]